MESFMTHLDDDDDVDDGEDILPTATTNDKKDSDSTSDDDTTDEEEETLLPMPTAATTITAAVAPEDTPDDDVDSDDDSDDDDDDAAEIAVPGGGKHASIAAATATAAAAVASADTEEDNDNDSDDGELPLATPYPWAHDDYELTLHHDPKKRKPVGTGIIYVKRLMQDADSSNHEEATILSDPAKSILKQLFAQSSRKIEVDDDSSEEESDEEDDDDEEEDDEETIKKRRHLPGPRLWTTTEGSIHDSSLFHDILQEVEKEHPAHVSTRFIIRELITKLPAADIPGAFDSKDFVCCALHFLSSEWKSPDLTVLPSLPLIKSTTAPGNARDLEKRTYEKAGAWKLEDLEKTLPHLQRVFLESPAAADQLQYIGRVRFCPRRRPNSKYTSETSILWKGTMPARMQGKKQPTASTSTSTTAASAKSSTTGTAKKGTKRKAKKQGVNLQPQVQGKQFPYAIMASQSND